MRIHSGIGAVCLYFSELTPEEKVNLAINMTDVCVSICAEGIRDQYPGITKDRLLELRRERIAFGRQLNVESRKWKLFGFRVVRSLLGLRRRSLRLAVAVFQIFFWL